MLVVFFVVRALESVHDCDKFILYVAELACWHCALLFRIFNWMWALVLDRLANTPFALYIGDYVQGSCLLSSSTMFFFCCHASNMSRCEKVTSTHNNGRVCVSHVVIPVVDVCFSPHSAGVDGYEPWWTLWRSQRSVVCVIRVMWRWNVSTKNFCHLREFFFFSFLLSRIFAKMEVTCRDDGLLMCHNKLLSWTPSFLFVSSPLWMVNIMSNVSSWNHMETQACTRPAARGFKVLVQKTRKSPGQPCVVGPFVPCSSD